MLRRSLCLVTFLFFCGLPIFVTVHAAPQNRTLVLTGHPGELPVLETGGRSYVDIEALTRLANGTLSFRGNQIVLTLPTVGASAPPTNPETDQPRVPGFSKDFLKAGLEEMAVIREWRSALINAIQQGHPVTEDWVETFGAQAQQNLRLVSLAASTDSDRNALQLLNNEFNNMKKLSNRFVETTKSRTYVSPNALESDPLCQKVLNCAHSLAAMASNNQFVDDGSCH
jgi:hypothetical protein